MAKFALVITALLCLAPVTASAESSHELFNGKDLSDWKGDPRVWSVEDGAIVGRTQADDPIEDNTFLIWKGGTLKDFRLSLEYRIEGGNSGVQYRSKVVDPAKWIVAGYQADIDSGPTYTGILYEERGRGILAQRGERKRIAADGTSEVERFADAEALQRLIHTDDWNQYTIEAIGPRLRHTINGKRMSVTIDRERCKRAKSGVLALQVHKGPPMTVRFRNIRLTHLDHKQDKPRNAPEE